MSAPTVQRVLTALILMPLVAAAVWWGPNSLVAAMAALVAIVALREFFSMAVESSSLAYRYWTFLAAAAVMAQQSYVARLASASNLGELLSQSRSPRPSVELILFGFVLGLAVIALASARPLAEALPAASVSAAGLVFIALPFSAVIRLQGVDLIGRQLLLFVLVLVWVGDIAAFFVGRSIGRLKMAPHLSPSKTWEGALANFLGALVVAALFGYWVKIQPVHMLAMGALGNVAGQLGDLFESAWKRSAGVKDSGTILPGHGGMLDRIDALILAAPAVWYYFEWFVSKRY